MTKIHLRIRGMHCNHCIQTIQTLLKNVKGVKNAAVRLGEAEAEWDDAVAKKTDLLQAIRSAGAFEIEGFSTTP